MALTCIDASSIYNDSLIELAHERARAASGSFRSVPIDTFVPDTQLVTRARALETQSLLQINDCPTIPAVIEKYADKITRLLNPPTQIFPRTRTNVLNFLRSNRLTEAEMNNFIHTLPHNLLHPDSDELARFRQSATFYFTRANLFYYEYLPEQGAVMCFNRQTN